MNTVVQAEQSVTVNETPADKGKNSVKVGRIAERAVIILLFIVMLVYCLSLLVPLVWMVITSFKDQFDYSTDIFGLPTLWMSQNYITILEFLPVKIMIAGRGEVVYGIGLLFFNTIARSVGIPFLVVMCQAMVSYVLARYRFVGNKFIYTLGIVVMITPIVGSLPSAMLISKALGTYNNLLLNILTAPSNIFGLHFLILYGFFKSVPKDFSDAARIDGAGDYMVFFKIMLPMAAPTCAALFVLSFLGVWNDYSTPIIWLPHYPNLAYALYILQLKATAGAEGANTPEIMAGFVIVMVPTVILFFIAHNAIINKMFVGGLKG